MKQYFGHIALLALLLCFLLFNRASTLNANGGEALNFIFTPDTPPDYLEDIYNEMFGQLGAAYNLAPHWDPAATATGDGGANQGDALTLTWSIIPDGTAMPKIFSNDTACNSTLIADMNANYGAGNWQNEIANVFADWASKTGNEYVFEPNDDGAPWPNSAGVPGVRGDIRIGGCTIDGNSGILAFNFFPSNGDMKIDSPDSFYDSASLSTAFHNVISHEHGHGAGLEHVCPVNQTKLMEPFVTTAFKGLQHDDIRAVQRHYGDRYELIGADNDVAARASNLGTPAYLTPVTIQGVSIDDNSDTDWYQFAINAPTIINISVTPTGTTYQDWDQNLLTGACNTSGPTINSAAIHNLNFQIIDSDGSTVLATANANPAGVAESLSNIGLGAAGVKYIRVFGNTTDDIQLYNLQFTLQAAVFNVSTTTDPFPVQANTSGITYTLTVQNNTGLDTTGVTITSTVPNSTTYQSGGDSFDGNNIVWNNLSINSGSSADVSFWVTVAVPITDGDRLINAATVTSTQGITGALNPNTVTVGLKLQYLPLLTKNF